MSWSWVQSASHAASSVTSVAATFGSGMTSGSKMIAWVSSNASTHGLCTAVSDGHSNAFTKVADTGQPGGTGNFGGLQCWVLDTPAGDNGLTITATASFDSAAGQSILVQEITGLTAGTSASVDGTVGTNCQSTGGGSTITTGTPSYATAASSEYLASAAYSAGNGGGFPTFTGPSGYTLDTANQSNVSTLAAIDIGYKNSTGASESDGWTISATGGTFQAWAVIMIAFKLPASAVTDVPYVVSQNTGFF